jgi:hypothetical protein
MEYIESISPGDTFQLQGMYFVLTSDFKSNRDRLCINLIDGSTRWLNSSTMVDIVDLFTLDKESNILAIKPRKKDNEHNINQN